MTEYPAVRSPDRCLTHPGAMLDHIIPALGMPKAEIARLLDISRRTLHNIIAEKKPVSPIIAAKLGKLFGDDPGIRLRMQAAYDAWHVEREVDVSGIPTIKAA